MLANLRHAFRFLRRRPSYALAATLTIALGVGVNAAVFQLVHDVLLRPFDIERPDRLVVLHETDPSDHSLRENASLPDYDDFRASARSFSALAAYRRLDLTLSGAGLAPERLSAVAATASLLPLLGREPSLGRALEPRDDQPGAAGVALLSDQLWRRRFDGSPSALDAKITLDGRPYSVVGVLPPGLEIATGDVWVALEPHVVDSRHERDMHGVRVLARLADGVDLAAAQSEMTSLAERLATTYPDENAGRGVFVEPATAALIGDARRTVLLLAAASALVFLVTCANLAGLVLAQMAPRGAEIALRRSLGAASSTLFGQLTAESALVALAGGLLGAVAASPALQALLRLSPTALPRAVETSPNLPLFLFSLAAAFAVAVAVGAAAGLWSARVAPARALATRTGERHGALRVRRALVVLQVALAVSLSAAAGLLVASFDRLAAERTGVDVEVLTVAQTKLPSARFPFPARAVYPNWPEATAFYDRLLEELARIPGATGAALALNHPLEPGWTTQVAIDGREAAVADREEVRIRAVTPGYFRVVGLPLVAGRELAPGDRDQAPRVAVVNRAFVRRYLPDVDPLGHTATLWVGEVRIVGVVEDERFLGLDQPSAPALYPALHQLPMPDFALVVRGSGSDLALGSALERALQAVDPEIAAYDIQPLSQALSSSIAAPRLRTTLFALFGALTVALAALGLYGIVASDVERRRRELGVRFALGARAGTVVSAVLGSALALGAVGAVLGVAGAVAIGRSLAALLYRTSPLDPWALGGAACGALAVALAAAALPALRAARVDPMTVLREE